MEDDIQRVRALSNRYLAVVLSVWAVVGLVLFTHK